MKDKDYIKELFSEKLAGHEVPVRSELWAGIQSQIGNVAATAAAKGLSVAAKWAIGIASSVIVAGTVAWIASDNGAVTQHSKNETQISGPVTPAERDEQPLQTAPADKESTVASGTRTLPADNTRMQKAAAGTDDNRQPEIHTPLIVGPAANNGTRTDESTQAPADERRQPTVNENRNTEGQKPSSGEPVSTTSKEAAGKIGEYPNVFTPNNDGVNDFFFLRTSNLNDFSLTILDEKNHVVYTSTDPDFKWDGLDQRTSEPVPAGNYGYVVMALDKQGNVIKIFKNLQISK